MAEAAIRAGCKCYFGYTQQPRNQTSIPKPLLHKLYGSRALKQELQKRKAQTTKTQPPKPAKPACPMQYAELLSTYMWLIGMFSLFPDDVYAAEPLPDEYEKLLSAPLQLNLSGRNLIMETSIWLDLMPRTFDPKRPSSNCSKEGPLIVNISLIATNLAEFPTGVKLNRLWVRKGDKWWEGLFSESESKISNNRLNKIARGCPPLSFEAIHFSRCNSPYCGRKGQHIFPLCTRTKSPCSLLTVKGLTQGKGTKEAKPEKT
ncbi:MAG: hypothetical protein HZA06_01460 [Nitrospirae bacterium]|nr:hypothetical protein [Nitrospirota bacterium]